MIPPGKEPPPRSADRPHLLVFEPDGRGHAREWIEYLIDWTRKAPDPADITVLTDAPLARELSRHADMAGRSRIRICTLSRTETALCNSRRLAVSGIARWWTMRRHLEKTGANSGFFLGFDHLTLPLGLGWSLKGQPVSGILFRPSVHYTPAPGRTWRERTRNARKNLLYRGMTRNRCVRTIWSLDPHFPAFAAAAYPHGDKVRAIPDPVCSPVTLPRAAVRDPAPRRTTFLLFGVMASRKGVFELIDALMRIESSFARAIHVVIAGEVVPQIAARFATAAAELRTRRPELFLEIDNRRLQPAEIAGYVAAADVVLAPYQHFVGSSGVLMWAANAGKPVITQSYGLLGRHVADYGLGLAVDTTDPSVLAAAIVVAVREGAENLADPTGMSRFLEGHSPETFATRIMENALGIAGGTDCPQANRSRSPVSTD